jgi:predicted Fe-Mo cluster-binding NifX family protein
MKIAVTSTGKTLDSQVDPRFGRANCFIIIETETMDHSVVENASIAAAGGAGISAAKAVAGTGAEAVLTGNCGPNAQRTLDAAGIELYTNVAGTVAEAVERFKSGELTIADGPNVQSHSGMDK